MLKNCSKRSIILHEGMEIRNKPPNVCVVEWAQQMFDYARRESCGKCVFCREGTMQIFTIINHATTGKAAGEDLELLVELAQMIKENASCEMASTVTDNLLIAIETYLDEWEMHLKRKRCPALVCKAYTTLHILPENCQGCNGCSAVCLAGAIAGVPGLIHVIDQEKCQRCGVCLAACPSNAVVKAGAIKPKTPQVPIPVGGWEANSARRRRR